MEAWIAGVNYLLENGNKHQLILAIEQPAKVSNVEKTHHKKLDEIYIARGKQPVHTVAETIFPAWEYARVGRTGVFANYRDEYRALKPSSGRWGSYIGRMTQAGSDRAPITDGDGSVRNPLDELVAKMAKSYHSPQKYPAMYELGIYSHAQDSKRYRNQPCMTHLSFKLVDNKVHLAAMYRYHDYAYKVPGNLLGLARLQAFVAREVSPELGVGRLVIDSTLAFLDGLRTELGEIVGETSEMKNVLQ
jgi:hypothetical protein